MLAEWFEGYGVVNLAGGLAGVVQGDEVGRHERLPRNGMCIVVLSKAQIRQMIGHFCKWTHLSQGIMFVRSKTLPVPSALRATTGCSNG